LQEQRELGSPKISAREANSPPKRKNTENANGTAKKPITLSGIGKKNACASGKKLKKYEVGKKPKCNRKNSPQRLARLQKRKRILQRY